MTTTTTAAARCPHGHPVAATRDVGTPEAGCATSTRYGLYDTGSASFAATGECVNVLAAEGARLGGWFEIVELCAEHGADLVEDCPACWG